MKLFFDVVHTEAFHMCGGRLKTVAVKKNIYKHVKKNSIVL